MEAADWKEATTNEPQPEVPVLFFFLFFFDGICERPLVSLSLVLSLYVF